MNRLEVIDLGEFGVFEVALPSEPVKLTWHEAKVAAKKMGQKFRLPLDYELEELFKSSLFRGILKNSSYWSGTETAHTRARSQFIEMVEILDPNGTLIPGMLSLRIYITII